MLRKIVGVGCVVAFLLLGFSEVRAEKNDRIAIFYEEGFPTESPRSIEWYKNSLEKIGLKAKILGVKETADTKTLSKKNFDTFILATGGNIPYKVEYSIFNFMAEGGNLIVDGSLFYPSSFHTGSLKHGVLKYNEEERIWENVNYVAHNNMTTKSLGSDYTNFSRDFQFRPGKFKSLSSPLDINPVFANLLKELPSRVGPFAFAGKVRLCAILELIHNVDYNCCGGKCLEYLTNILLPIYKGGDFCVYRYHNNYYNNSSLVHFGILGSYLLSSSDGEKFLYSALELCEMKLPGEKEPSYYERVIELQQKMSDFNKIFIKTHYSLRDICFSYFYQGNKEKFQESKKRMETSKRDWISIINSKQKIDGFLKSGSDHIKFEDNLRKILLTRVEAEIGKLSILNEEIDRKISRINYPGQIEIKNPLKRIHFEADISAPIGIYSLKRDFYKTLKELGITEALSTVWFSHTWQCYPEVSQASGIKFPVIILDRVRSSWFKWLKPSQTGILDPLTGDVKYKKTRDYDYDLAAKKISWIISQHKNSPVFGYYWGSEAALGWNFWGEEAKKEYQEYLKGKYKDIKVLNQRWRTNYKAFAEIELLTKRPSTLSEHSNWEDWTNFREKKYIDDCQWHYDLIKKNDPDKPILNHLSRNLLTLPANGANLYRISKTTDYIGIHHGWKDDLEWRYFDLNDGKQVFCTEWGVHYWPNQDIIEDTQKMREKLWEELGAGQVGWSIFIWRWAGFSGNYVDMTGLPTLYGWELKNFIEDTKKFDHIILDGKRKEPKIRILYSHTTRCHDCWANDSSKTTASTDGFYLSFLTNHIPARVMAEEEILEGKPIDNYRLIVLPRTEYLSEELQKKLLNYVKEGGNILITGDSGKFDNYGHLKNSFFMEAGIAKTKPKKREILLDGAVYPVLAKNFHLTFSLSPFFPEKTKTLLSYESGEPALLSTSIGKGKIIISGIPFGLNATRENPEIAEKILDIILKDIKLEKRFICEDKNIVLRDWEYGKDEYLILTYPKRKGIKEFSLKIRGKYKVIDYMLGEEAPSSFDGKYTIVRGIILSPGGRVYQLKKESSFRIFFPEKKMAPKIKTEDVSLEKEINENNKESADKDFFYKGRLYASEEPEEIDDYILKINAIVSRADDKADIYLSIRKGRERIEKKLEAGKEFFYCFSDKALLVKCLKLTDIYPRSAEIEIRKAETKSIVSACSFSEKICSGSKNLLLKNGLIKVRIVPDAGGRIIEYSTLDGMNHLGDGIEENVGTYPGPFLNQRFSYQLLKDTPGEVKVLLKMDRPINGLLLEKVITIKRNSSTIGLEVKKYNYKGELISSALTIHPNLNIGGDSLGEDTFFIPQKNGIEILPYSCKGVYNYFFTPENNWAGCVDKDERIAYITSFLQEEVKQVYIWMGASNYNLEIFAKDKKLKHLGFHPLNIKLSLIRGISGIDSYNAEHGIASYIFLNNTLFSQGKNIKFIVETGSNCLKRIKSKIFICDKEGKKIKEWEEWGSILAFNKPAEKEFIFSPKGLSDGEYNISFQIKDDKGRIVSKVQKPFFLIGKEKEGNLKVYKKFRQRLNLLKKKYPSKYQELTKIFISLEEFYVAIEENKREEIDAKMGEIEKALQKRECSN